MNFLGIDGGTLLIEGSFEFFEVLAEHVLSTEFGPSSKMVDFGSRLESIFFIDPINLLFFTPHNIPIVAISFSPVSIVQTLVDTVSKCSFEFDVLTECYMNYGGVG